MPQGVAVPAAPKPAPVDPSAFWTLDRVTDALSSILVGVAPRGSGRFSTVNTDTRSVAAGNLFVALKGERFDAHAFLADAVSKGAAAVVVSDVKAAATLGVPAFVVADTTVALGLLGRYRRRVWGKTVVAVAGSNGKTSTKELTSAALASRLSVYATRGNLNNHIGVPLTLLAIPDDADVAVVEIGTNHPGEVAMLRALVEPDLAIVTSIGEEHLEGLGDLAGVLREESAVFADVPVAIVPAAQPEVAEAARTLAKSVVAAGLSSGDLRPDSWSIAPDGAGVLRFGDVEVRPPLRGEHNLRNAMLAIATARALGVTIEDAAAGIARTPALPMRSAWIQIGGITVINDAYNANPASARESLRMLAALDTTRQRVAILGSMLELGAAGPALHDEIAEIALNGPAQVIVGIGEFARTFKALAPDDARVIPASDAPDAWPALAKRLAPDAVILLKGSRGTRLERLIASIESHAGIQAASPSDQH
ncbi:MAG TPA: UDP-N-acetylmuramoyl-tripeptide--D-alanyl-D-alanine ligase [Gemmatimonadaceae bacterium]|nr:UDP-N-acetylmuramoyl-tripeptide--D-alanyl-D-alanine ligase [Gemmatimonadaceae bacterium]